MTDLFLYLLCGFVFNILMNQEAGRTHGLYRLTMVFVIFWPVVMIMACFLPNGQD